MEHQLYDDVDRMRYRTMFEDIKQHRLKDKAGALATFKREILSKTSQIFEYRNLPPELEDLVSLMETRLQEGGHLFFQKVKGDLYFFYGSAGGERDAYYIPTMYVVSNPALNHYVNARIGVDGVLMKNDTFGQGLLPIIEKYGMLLVEAMISFNNAIINTRDYNAFSAQDNRTRKSAELYQKKIEAGETAVIAETAMLDGLKRHPAEIHSGALTELKEFNQYIKAQLFSDLGLKTAHNMKSQYVSDAENIINDDTLLPLVQDMLTNRQIAVKAINQMYDLDIEVELSGTWKLQQEKVDMEVEALENGELLSEDQEGVIEPQETEEVETPPEVVEEPGDPIDEPEKESEDAAVDIEININQEVQTPEDAISEWITDLKEDQEHEETEPSH